MKSNGKINCWDFIECGREPCGENEKELGVCIAATETRLNGIHGGINGGRACWAIAGTLCDGEVQGTFAQKIDNCMDCDFYQLVYEENKEDFKSIIQLISVLTK